ncbi:MAG: 50S ribosomal protein L4 [Candidatus Aminicenantes bacterium]|nr:50S ribosomal protein L4 [Candidatus Aminicenantes bacterium]
MVKIKIKNIQSDDVSEMELPEEIFNYPLKEHLIYEAVKNFRANRRSGNAATKTRGKVSGSGKKLWRQKGTGRARMGSIRSPLWRTGGITFGPQPRDYSYKMPKRAKRNALKSVLSEKMRNERIWVIDKIDVDSNRTKETLSTLKKFNFDKLLIVDKKENSKLILSTRNIPNIKAIDCSEINVYDTLKYNYIMFSVDAVNKLVEVLKK